MAEACPICSKPATADARPFCSKRCADIDLHRWLSGGYVIAGRPAEDEEDAPPTRPEEADITDSEP
jgi:endogenous inhibitor of DNA gyrase (YacG/DUF329 family)